MTSNTEYKHRIHPKEAGHSIEDLPSLSLITIESDRMGATEILKSLGLEVSGAGKGAEMWFVGAGERIGDEKEEARMSVEAKATSADGTDGGERGTR